MILSTLPKGFVSTLFHVLEILSVGIAVILLCALAHKLIGLDVSGDIKVVLVGVISGLPKAARALDTVPIKDYVNSV